ncbi:hypothetical protein TraAM80_03672 [Trypanosoma rangeli]|uniref:Treble clef zinc finger domain-containing protein n=1 Tax=Trypanosoma rangeli TaxID=5698 RepID=A0A3R7NSK5_TRYRA|nr:uncharacterized protein TraAM80_03672 [Trypanosoma rangeli]RNF07038.1 hypothetical protein TraAM80_03672 [Trypanosoma rangeli]|eukprot:RNF07038.1 hypothetical protein TraAM80_03672 [Trypanosoma rangeli]
MRRFSVVGALLGVSCSPPRRTPSTSSSLPLSSSLSLAFGSPSGHVVVSQRFKASYIRVANRKRVEMFLAKRFHLPTRLKTAAPEIAAEWDHEKNPMHLYPEIVGIGHVAPVWWRCGACQHSFSMSVEKRVVRGGGCPACTAVKAAEGEPKGVNALEGERNPDLRPKRPVMFNLRTKY